MVILRLALVAAALAVAGRFFLRRREAPEAPAPRDVAATDPVAEVIEQEWTCRCGQAYRVSGEGRHRVYWPADAEAKDPVLGGECVSCQTPLPRE